MGSSYRMAMQALEQRDIVADIEAMLTETRQLVGLDDWTFEVTLAPKFSRLEADMLEEGRVAFVGGRDTGAKTVAFAFCYPSLVEMLAEDSDELWRICLHEWWHIVLNPYGPSGRFMAWRQYEEMMVTHLTLGCCYLRFHPHLRPHADDDLEALVEKAYHITRLDENNWDVRIERHNPIVRGDERVPALAYSHFGEDHAGWALFGARVITLEVDEGLVGADDVLRELWRAVLTAWDKPVRESNPVIERQLEHVMKAMEGLGWASD